MRSFSVEAVNHSESKIKNLFQFYTGLAYVHFLVLLAFLLPAGEEMCCQYVPQGTTFQSF